MGKGEGAVVSTCMQLGSGVEKDAERTGIATLGGQDEGSLACPLRRRRRGEHVHAAGQAPRMREVLPAPSRSSTHKPLAETGTRVQRAVMSASASAAPMATVRPLLDVPT